MGALLKVTDPLKKIAKGLLPDKFEPSTDALIDFKNGKIDYLNDDFLDSEMRNSMKF